MYLATLLRNNLADGVGIRQITAILKSHDKNMAEALDEFTFRLILWKEEIFVREVTSVEQFKKNFYCSVYKVISQQKWPRSYQLCSFCLFLTAATTKVHMYML